MWDRIEASWAQPEARAGSAHRQPGTGQNTRGRRPGAMGPERGPGGDRSRFRGEACLCEPEGPGWEASPIQCGSHDKASPATDTGEDEGAGSFCAT